MIFPINVVDVVKQGLAADRREPDGKLHASSHLIGSLRHAMLEVAGAPKIESDFVSDLRMMTGTMWHSKMETLLKSAARPHTRHSGKGFISELKLDEWMPEGWSGTADWLFYSPDHGAWVLGDLKTIKGEGIQWIARDGAKTEHLWQLSAYFWALVNRGMPLVEEFGILYLPMNTVAKENVEPILCECKPLPRDLVWGRMEGRWALTQDYINGLRLRRPYPEYSVQEAFLTDKLAPVQPREQKVLWNGKAGVFELKLCPHWSTTFCPYPNELCDCSEQGVTKLGTYDLDGSYTPRKDYEDVIPLVEPAETDLRKRAA